MLFIRTRQKLDGYEHFLTRLRIAEKYDRLQVFAQRHAAAVEVNDLRHRSVGVGAEAKPHPCAGQVVAIQGLRHFNLATEPHCFLGRRHPVMAFRVSVHLLPTAVIERWILTVWHVALVVPPGAAWQGTETLQSSQGGLFLRRQIYAGMMPVVHLEELRAKWHGGERGKCKRSAAGKTSDGTQGNLLYAQQNRKGSINMPAYKRMGTSNMKTRQL